MALDRHPVIRLIQRLCQGIQDEIGALGNTHFGQNCHLVAEGRIHVEQTPILGNGSLEAMAPLRIRNVDFWPRWSEKSTVMIPMLSNDNR
jgi:hypothetical protein